MKQSEIKVGATYASAASGQVLRRVTKMRKGLKCVWSGRGDAPDEPVVEFERVPGGQKKGNVRDGGRVYLRSFAAWAGQEVPDEGRRKA